MAAAKNSSLLQDAIDRLKAAEPGWKAFDRKPAVGAKPGNVSTGRPASGKSATLEESDAALRTYFATRTLTSSDGLFSIEWAPIQTISLVSGGVFEFKEPPA